MACVIVVSGLSGSGKTTLISSLIGDGTIGVPSASMLRRERYEYPDISPSKQDTLEKQRYYFNLDKKVSKIASEIYKSGRIAICDRDFLSAVAHNYAIHHTKNEISIYPWIVKNYVDALRNDELIVPDFHVFLDVPIE